MARKRPHGSGFPSRNPNGYVRDSLHAADDLFLQPLPSLFNQSVVRSPLSEFEDDRYWNPDTNPESRTLRGSRTSRLSLAPRALAPRSSRRLLFDMQQLTFNRPKFVIRCIRRKIRDEVLHALGKTGKGSGRKLRNRKYNRNQHSNIRC